MEKQNEIVKQRMVDEVQIISLSGRMTYDDIGLYKKQIEDIIQPAQGYIVDLKNVQQIDSTGLGLLINVARNFIQNKEKVVIVNEDELIQELFEVSKLDKVFAICKTLAEAQIKVRDADETFWSRVKAY